MADEKTTPIEEASTQVVETTDEALEETSKDVKTAEEKETDTKEGRLFSRDEMAIIMAKDFPNYREYKDKAEQFDQVEADLKDARARIAELEGKDAVRALIEQVADETKVPAKVLRGSTLEEIQAHAKSIQESLQSYPVVDDDGEKQTPTLSKEEILAIKDSSKRKTAIAQNIELFT